MDKKALAPLMEKMGDEAFKDIFKRFNDCYDQHAEYIVLLNN